MRESRLTERIIKYWEHLKKDDALPYIERFIGENIGDMWDYCLRMAVIDPHLHKPICRIEYMGKQIISTYGRDLTGEVVSKTLAKFPGSVIMVRLEEILTTKTYAFDEGQFPSEKGQMVKFRSCLVPFGRGDMVTHVIAAVSWKAFS